MSSAHSTQLEPSWDTCGNNVKPQHRQNHSHTATTFSLHFPSTFSGDQKKQTAPLGTQRGTLQRCKRRFRFLPWALLFLFTAKQTQLCGHSILQKIAQQIQASDEKICSHLSQKGYQCKLQRAEAQMAGDQKWSPLCIENAKHLLHSIRCLMYFTAGVM